MLCQPAAHHHSVPLNTSSEVFFPSQISDSQYKLALPNPEELEKTRRQADKISHNKHLKLSIPSEILQGKLYLCAAMDTYAKETLEGLGVTHVLCLMEKPLMPYPDVFQYKFLVLSDEESENIYDHLDEVSDYIDSVISAGGCIAVHCFAGHSRSASFVAAYLMKYHKQTLAEALEYIRKRRRSISPNDGFIKQLSMFGDNISQGTQSDSHSINEMASPWLLSPADSFKEAVPAMKPPPLSAFAFH